MNDYIDTKTNATSHIHHLLRKIHLNSI